MTIADQIELQAQRLSTQTSGRALATLHAIKNVALILSLKRELRIINHRRKTQEVELVTTH